MTTIEQTFRRVEYLKKAAEKQKKENGRISLFSRLELEYFEEVLKDLELLEKYKRDMCEPIQDIMKCLKILDILKPYIELSSDGIISCHNLILTPYYKDYEEQYNLLKEWLENANNF